MIYKRDESSKINGFDRRSNSNDHIRDTFEIQDLVKKSSLIPFRADVARASIQRF